MSDTPDAVSPVPDAVSPTQDGESRGDDAAAVAKPKATSKRKGKGRTKSRAKKADAASTDSVRDDDAAHAEFIAQFPTTDPDAEAGDYLASEAKGDDAPEASGRGDATAATTTAEDTDVAPPAEPDEQTNAAPVDDVKSETDDSETAQAPTAASEASDGVSTDDKADTCQPSGTEAEAAAVDTAEPSEARGEAEASADEVGGEIEKESAADVQAGEAAADAETDAETTAADAPAATAADEAAAGAPAETSADAEGVAAQETDTTPAPAPKAIPAAAAIDPDVDGTDDPDEALLDDDDDVSSWVRPYVWTGGRTETSMDFAIETLVSAREQVAGTEAAIRDEHRRVLELCEEPRSVTEIAALLSVPLGVAKTLLGAMVEDDLVVVHRTNGSAAGPDLALMERVLRGLKKL
ncbi:MAG: DUF742 domain-containing protein [Actinophytocola sp.]|nr:DUF742 domain-containing protein [Actinophytocola sp.]